MIARTSILFVALLALPASAAHYHVVQTVKLPGDGFWDYLGFDPANRHLFVTHGTHVQVLDADSLAIVGDIAGTPQVHGVAVAPDLGRGFTSNGGDNSVTAFDLKSLAPAGRYPTGTRPDSIAYEPVTHRVFTFNGGSHDATALDAATGAVAGTIALDGKPETGVADGLGHLFVNIEDKSQIVELNAQTLSVIARWPIAPCDSPSGLALDARNGLLFAGCDNAMMAVVDTATGKVLATPAIGKGVDADRFDPETGDAFASNGADGTLTVIHEDGTRKFHVVETVPTEKAARTMEVDPKTHRVFVVTADREPVPPTADNPHPRPRVVPGSFRLLVLVP